jgi:hypothetical protein
MIRAYFPVLLKCFVLRLRIFLLFAFSMVGVFQESAVYAANYTLTVSRVGNSDIVATEGSPVSFRVFAYSTPSTPQGRLYYQWWYHSQKISGATSEQYTIPSVVYSDVLGGSGLYHCEVSTSPSFSSYSGNKDVMSDSVILTVQRKVANCFGASCFEADDNPATSFGDCNFRSPGIVQCRAVERKWCYLPVVQGRGQNRWGDV